MTLKATRYDNYLLHNVVWSKTCYDYYYVSTRSVLIQGKICNNLHQYFRQSTHKIPKCHESKHRSLVFKPGYTCTKCWMDHLFRWR